MSDFFIKCLSRINFLTSPTGDRYLPSPRRSKVGPNPVGARPLTSIQLLSARRSAVTRAAAILLAAGGDGAAGQLCGPSRVSEQRGRSSGPRRARPAAQRGRAAAAGRLVGAAQRPAAGDGLAAGAPVGRLLRLPGERHLHGHGERRGTQSLPTATLWKCPARFTCVTKGTILVFFTTCDSECVSLIQRHELRSDLPLRT